MSYNRYSSQAPKKPKWEIHPVWRGVGCLMFILIPVMSYLSAQVFFQYAPSNWLKMFPPGAFRNFVVPYIDFEVPITLGITIMTIVFMIALFGVYTIVYALFIRVAGPSKYGPTDAPPIRRKVRKSR